MDFGHLPSATATEGTVNNALPSTFVQKGPPSTYDYTQGGIFSTRKAIEAHFPDESVYMTDQY